MASCGIATKRKEKQPVGTEQSKSFNKQLQPATKTTMSPFSFSISTPV